MEEAWIKDEIIKILIKISKWKGFEIHSYHVGEEHIHLYITIPPRYSISYAMSVIKGKTSRWIKKKTNKMGEKSIWSKGYFVSTIGINEMAVRKYIENQDRPKVRDVQTSMLKQA
jgi:putative transposase